MPDIVERLRSTTVYEEHKAITSNLGDEAAAEIERLRAALIALLEPQVTDEAGLEQFLRDAEELERHALKQG